jgi:hypothetical protein
MVKWGFSAIPKRKDTKRPALMSWKGNQTTGTPNKRESMKVLVACEFSGIVRDAFIARGHDAMSCDLLPTERPGPHYQGDVRDVLADAWDLIIAHPPCQHLAVSGARWFAAKRADGRQQQGIDFFMLFTKLTCRWAIENPIGIMSKLYRKPNQTIQPYHFGHSVSKATCLWLNGLPTLRATKIVDRGMIYVDPRGHSHGGAFTLSATKKMSFEHRQNAYSPLMLLPHNEDRWKIRSRTFQGVADAMADQWGQ